MKEVWKAGGAAGAGLDELRVPETLCQKLQGKTQRQRNPHPEGPLAFAIWIIPRLGRWPSYYGKPGLQVICRGPQDFRGLKCGRTLLLHDVRIR